MLSTPNKKEMNREINRNNENTLNNYEMGNSGINSNLVIGCIN